MNKISLFIETDNSSWKSIVCGDKAKTKKDKVKNNSNDCKPFNNSERVATINASRMAAQNTFNLTVISALM